MRINGRDLSIPRIEIIVIPRQDGDIVFKAQAVRDYSIFEKLCPQPKPPKRLLPGGIESSNVDDPIYQQKLEDWSHQRWDWMFLKSLQVTEGLEWESVNMEDPSTFGGYKEEMAKAFSPSEIAFIESKVIDACGLNQAKIEQATKAFLATQGKERNNESSPVTEASSMPSGEPVSVST